MCNQNLTERGSDKNYSLCLPFSASVMPLQEKEEAMSCELVPKKEFKLITGCCTSKPIPSQKSHTIQTQKQREGIRDHLLPVCIVLPTALFTVRQANNLDRTKLQKVFKYKHFKEKAAM